MKTKTKKLFLSLFAFASLAITACSGNNGGSSGAGDSSGSVTTSSESSSGSDTSTTSEADVDTNLYVKVDNGEEQTIAYDEDEGTYTIGPVELTTSQVIEIYIKDDGVKQSALDIINVEAGSAAYLDVDEDEGTVSVTSDGTYTFVFTYDDGELSLAITKEADPSQEGYAVKINDEFKSLVVAEKDATGEDDVTEKYKIESQPVKAGDAISFYKDGEVLAVLSDKEDSTNVNNINEHSVSEDTTTPFTIHNDATVGIYFKHRVGTTPEPYDGWRFWITGYQGEPPIPPVSNKTLHIKRGTADTPVALVANPGNEQEVMAQGVALQAGDSIYIDMGNSDYRGYADLNNAGAAAYFVDDTEDHHNLKVADGKAGNYDFYIKLDKGTGSSVSIIKPRSGDVTTTNYPAALGDDFGGTHVVYVHAWGTFGAETYKLTDLTVLPIKSDVSQFVLVSFAPGTTDFDWDTKLTQTGDITPDSISTAVLTIDVVGDAETPTTYHWQGGAVANVNYLDLFRGSLETKQELINHNESEYKLLNVELKVGDVFSFCVKVSEADHWVKHKDIKSDTATEVKACFKSHEAEDVSVGNFEVLTAGSYDFYVAKDGSVVYIAASTPSADRTGWKAVVNDVDAAVTLDTENLNQINLTNKPLVATNKVLFSNADGSVTMGYDDIKAALPAAVKANFEKGANNEIVVKADCDATYDFYCDLIEGIWIVKQGYTPEVKKVSFSVNYDTHNNGDLYLGIGPSGEDWTFNKMTWGTGNVWTVDLDLEVGTTYKFKCLVRRTSGDEYEKDPDRTLTVANDTPAQVLSWQA